MAKILHRFYDLYAGGAEVVVLNLVRALPEHTHVLVFTNYQPTWVAAELRRLTAATMVWVPDRDLRELLRRESPDVILYHYYPPMSVDDLTMIPNSLASRAAVYNHWHTPVPFVPAIHRYCFPSRTSSDTSGAEVPDDYQTVIINPVSDWFFDVERRPDAAFRIGRHSRGTPLKFPPDFFQICEQIDVPDLQVLALGHTPEMARWLAQHSSALTHTYWLLTTNTMDVARFLSWLDVYVYQTHEQFRETCPVSILEALAAGIPVVAEDRGGIVDLVVDGATGYLCRTADDYRAAVMELHANPKRRRRFSAAAREWARAHASVARFRREVAKWLNLDLRKRRAR